ncbi:PDZ domain-containing protein [Polyangium spumosum]|uniref:PDZ domain-containing protein n=1 Tax=Polyangium spumosum TaxID=889282 RepID=A0A6N7Q0I3_9BACT|nr:PDZ domain-containing protein [Polyangium spumosum]MRG95794.1 hypothetical protein [Polyangium spumosum]
MSSEPYRTPACPTCSAPHVEQAHICKLCKEPFHLESPGVEACDPCLREACRIVARAAARKPASRRHVKDALMRWVPPTLVVLTLGVLAFSTHVFVHTARRLIELRTSAERVAEHREKPQDKPRDKPRKKRHHKRDATPPAPPTPRAKISLDDESVPALTSVLAALSPEVHDPDALLARVHKLREAGLDIFLVRANLGKALFDSGADLRTRISPVHKGGRAVGVRVSRLGPDSIEALAGVQPGDVLVSVNGYGVDSPERALRGYAASREKGAAVFELLRNGRRVVLDVRWPK